MMHYHTNFFDPNQADYDVITPFAILIIDASFFTITQTS